MSAMTGIEFGPHSCVLVRARRHEGVIELTAGHVIEPSAWPSQTSLAAELLKGVRREKDFPRSARVVAWGLAEGAGARDPATRAVLRPLTAAGFRIDSVVSPQQALAILAADRPRPSGAAAVWLAVNRDGAAIAIVRGADVLFSRAFGWNWEGAAIGSQAPLLQRYSIVAHLAPEIRRAIEMVRTKHDVAVEAAVTCGDLPDLRSLTMPLIEELDLEVETLDSVEGLLIPPTARRDRLPDSLAAVRLACAAAAGPVVRGFHVDVVRLARAAAFLLAAGGLVWAGYVWWARPQPALVSSAAVTSAPQSTPKQAPAPSRSSADAGSAARPTSTSGAAGSPRSVPPPARMSGDRARESSRVPPEPARRVAPNPTPPPASRRTPTVESPQTAAAPRGERARPRAAPSAPASTDTPQARPRPQPQAAVPLPAPANPSPPVVAPPAERIPPAPTVARPTPLKDPLPVIETILVSSDRRLAVIDGAFVGIGDTVGARSVVRIEVDAVFLREPSGLELRVPIRVRRDL
jgi:hypothetical protein